MPKKGAFTHEQIIDGVLLFRNKLIKNYGSGNSKYQCIFKIINK